MTIKQFLKPDWRKIVLTIVLSLFVFFIIYVSWLSISAVVGRSIQEYCCNQVIPLEECPYDNLEYCEEEKQMCEYRNYTLENCEKLERESETQTLTFYLIVIVLNYLISCLIIWIYDKFRGKKI